MNINSHNPTGGAKPTQASANQLDPLPIACDAPTRQMSSAEQGREERDQVIPRSSRTFSGDYAELVHELANTIAAVLMNAQVLVWKLPPYSRLKRPLREIERNAQRGGELMKRLLIRLAKDATGPASEPRLPVPHLRLEFTNTVKVRGPGLASESTVKQPSWTKSDPVPGCSSGPEVELTSRCDGCTSTFPKKG